MTKSGLPTRVVADPRGANLGEVHLQRVMNPIGAIVQGVNAARYEVLEMRALIDDWRRVRSRRRGAGHPLEFDPMYLVKKKPGGRITLTKHAARWRWTSSRPRDRARGDDRLHREESEGAGRAGARHRKRIPGLAKGVEYAGRRNS